MEFERKTGLLTGTFALAKLQDCDHRFHALVRANGEVIDISTEFPTSQVIYGDWEKNFARLCEIEKQGQILEHEVGHFHFLPPVDFPQIYGAGSNYRQHAAEMYTYNEGEYQKDRKSGESDEDFYKRNLEFVEQKRAKGMPFIWLATHGSMVGVEDNIELPAVGESHDWEAELCAVIAGNSPRYMTPAEAGDYVAGYTIINDMHTCELFSRSDIKWNADWIAKHSPSFKATGPYVVPRQFFKTIESPQIRLWVNGEVKQDWPSNDMIFSEDEYTAYASERFKLLPGDLLMTGSPPGNGAFHGQFLKPGDTLEIEITGLGKQRNAIVKEELGDRKPHFGLSPFEH
ncbi:fumarylacetoacetate hydrolase family protein [Pseudomaricurvus alcaniphilus]|uniref:fumarylacetoacetate hydrolase family protein n=1 Tax=Pseudomaricurvus alcaniphilus TaxID=1166482 RepID=UPI001A9D20B6|nr:fumarylacetoacetate hydrolase family protein [Pseudomaricurvus alcaniphilus]